MILYLLRHAQAEDKKTDDASRELTDKGARQSERIGKFFRANGCEAEQVLTSPLVRARQTAEAFAAAAGDLDVEPVEWLSSGMTPETGIKQLNEYRGVESLVLVGHEPDFSRFAAHLLGCAGGGVKLRKAALAAFDLPSIRAAAGELHFLVNPKLISK